MTRDRRIHVAIVVGLVAAALAVYWPVRHYPFVAFDDDAYIYENPALDAGLTPAGVRWAFATLCSANYHPLTWLSFLFDRSAWQLRPGPMHAENVALHAASSALLFLLLLRMTGRRWPAAFVAAAFAVHPAHVESVAWVMERKDVLSQLFLLLAGHAYVSHARGRRWGYPALLLAYALSLLSKSTGVTWPAVLLLLDGWPLGRLRTVRWQRLLWEKLPLLAMAFAAAATTAHAQRVGGSMSRLDMVPLAARLGNGVVAYVRYVAEAVWPQGLAPFYRFRWPLPAWQVAGSAAVLVGATALAWRGRRRRPWVLVGWLWFLGTLVPMLGLVQVGSQARADRYLYLPMIGLTIAVAYTAAELPWRRAVAVAGVGAVVALGVAGARQVRVWADTETLRTRMMEAEGGEAAIDEWRGVRAAAAGRPDEAEPLLARAWQLDPTSYVAPYRLGDLRLRVRHDPGGAVAWYERADRAKPDAAVVHANWGVALLQLKRPAEAYEHLRRAEQLDPDAFEPHFNLGVMLLSAGRRDAAAAELREAVRVDPGSAAARAKLDAALAR